MKQLLANWQEDAHKNHTGKAINWIIEHVNKDGERQIKLVLINSVNYERKQIVNLNN